MYRLYLSVAIILYFAAILRSQSTVDMSNPRSSLAYFLDYINSTEPNYLEAGKWFDLSKPQDQIEVARKLKTLMDARGLVVDLSKVPDDNDYRDSITKKAEYVPFKQFFPSLKMIKNKRGHWVFSRESSLMIPILYSEVLPSWVENILNQLPDYFRKKYLGLELWQYSGILVMLFLIFVLHLFLSWVVDKILERSIWQKLHIGREHHQLVYALAKYFSMIIMMWLLGWFIPSLMLSAKLSSILYNIIDLFQTLFIMMFVLKAVSILRVYLMLLASKTPSKMDDQLIPVAIRILKGIVIGVALIHVLSLFGVNVTALIAGASVGALALALAAQDTFKNLFGSVMIFLDKPFQIGDYIQYGSIEGTVEEVGFRSTRIRRIDTSLISVPNGNITNDLLTNLGMRKFRMVEIVIGILYSSTSEKIQEYINELRKIPDEYDFVQKENQMIYLRNLSPSSIDIYFRIYIEAADFITELQRREQIIFSIIKAKDRVGVDFAYPSTSVYIEKMPTTPTFSSETQ